MAESKRKVLLGMSGGVDSSVAAALLLGQGYEVIGAFMKNWSDCEWRRDMRDAARVAAQLGLPFVTFDFEKAYRELVVDEMFREYASGRTPNPDVLCNRFVKFDLFVREADRLGCDFIATGHYARTYQLPNTKYQLLRSTDANKDQTYFLWAIDPNVLSRVLFPLGEMAKPQVRERARELGLATADKPDSVGICFVGEVDMKQFLVQRIPQVPGKIVTSDGKEVGIHDGLPFYTIGQREGLKIPMGEPYYVVEKRMETNELVVGSAFHPGLFKKETTGIRPNWFRKPAGKTRVLVRLRHRAPRVPCEIEPLPDDRVRIAFDEPQRAVTPGQSAVFYAGDEVIGGAIIE
ncbi:tRNA 2-thiouridine(34) synthase MnmA [Candidatus Uhrbacteria bacterium RIFCSPHIGHO2_01_FULL_63_20]|uniref:tRNA-specific 2-thiouridylase MnmA n=1 Tax=Candidatus Uhrbacteria bacterium RIFCSPHIGHO2_01_FULL_63_20 TaxID=1802385 RepID=A0A1F7TKA6_9BACT|nr:MAG: tRNA 2-thiouridine(34) synthase MnmA [Candidatus Uhrbacteria bacterium RIFCSPHIGHO2_01_FULL_63_20]